MTYLKNKKMLKEVKKIIYSEVNEYFTPNFFLLDLMIYMVECQKNKSNVHGRNFNTYLIKNHNKNSKNCYIFFLLKQIFYADYCLYHSLYKAKSINSLKIIVYTYFYNMSVTFAKKISTPLVYQLTLKLPNCKCV